MRLTAILPLAALSSAFVIPDEQVMNQVAFESNRPSGSIFDKVPSKDTLVREFENSFSKVATVSKNAFDEAIDVAFEAREEITSKFGQTKAWLDTATNDLECSGHGKHGKHGHHNKPNLTVYQLIAESKYTTKLAKLINEYDDLVELLNGTAANYTVFAPIDKAFEHAHGPKPSKEMIKDVLTYHVSSDFYPAGRVLVTHTIPSLLAGKGIGGEPQRLSTNIGLKGLTVNFYSRIIAINIVSTSNQFSKTSG